MQRFTSLRLSALRTSTLLPRFSSTPTPLLRYTSTSSPKSAEGASAESGGSRSKSAKETGSSPTAGAIPDSLSDGDMRGRTGGGKPLESSDHPPPQPKISNHSVPGTKVGQGLTEEQQKEVDEHNRDFEAKHDRAEPAADDKVDKSFWGNRDAGSKD